MAFVEPARVVAYFELRPDMRVVDFGTGSGEYAVAMAERILPNGKVYAVDVQKDLLVRLKNTFAERGIRNAEVVWGDIEEVGGTKLRDGLADFVLISNVLFQSESPYKLALEAKRILRPGGRAAVIEWSESFGNLGPRPEDVVPPAEARKNFESAGFQYEKDFPAGDHHYGMLFRR